MSGEGQIADLINVKKYKFGRTIAFIKPQTWTKSISEL